MGHKTSFVLEAVNNMGIERRYRAGTRFGSGAGTEEEARRRFRDLFVFAFFVVFF